MSGGQRELLVQILGDRLGFSMYRPTQAHRSMVPLADTSASGDHK